MSPHARFALCMLCLFAGGARAHDACERDARIDPELPAGFTGRYRLIGMTPEGRTYNGTLTLSIGDTHYTLVRQAEGHATRGEAWFERCGPDRIAQLAVRVGARPALAWTCQVATDGGNDYRVTCTGPRDVQARQGLEAWFQQP